MSEFNHYREECSVLVGEFDTQQLKHVIQQHSVRINRVRHLLHTMNNIFQVVNKRQQELVQVREAAMRRVEAIDASLHHNLQTMLTQMHSEYCKLAHFHEMCDSIMNLQHKFDGCMHEIFEGKSMCPVCEENTVDMVFLCGHCVFTTCFERPEMERCPFCKRNKIGAFKLFI